MTKELTRQEKRKIADEQLKPLAFKIYEICEKHDIAMIMMFGASGTEMEPRNILNAYVPEIEENSTFLTILKQLEADHDLATKYRTVEEN